MRKGHIARTIQQKEKSVLDSKPGLPTTAKELAIWQPRNSNLNISSCLPNKL